ncbi:MAG: hypothetical protein K2P51_01795 [Rhabdochlamydiaceae bacterium]|nr:hypothetical protein [Rhabdochlamydiaceae bacterium]
MIRSGEEILADIDATLDQLIRNAQTLETVIPDTFFANELQALQKTQESLLARLLHMNALLDEDQKKQRADKDPEKYVAVEKKVERFGKLTAQIIRTIADDFKRVKNRNAQKPRIGRNRKKLY